MPDPASDQTVMAEPPYCGDMPMRPGAMVLRDPKGGVAALFRGRRVAFSFNTRTALRQACDLLGLQPGDEVLAPAYNCGSELDPLLHAGLKVMFFPVDRQASVDVAAIEACITPRTRAIYLIHYFGFLQPMTAALRALCDARRLFLIEDCALSLLSGAAPAEGRAGDISVFCFYKFFPTIGGGALVINNDRIAGEARFEKKLPLRMTGKPLLRASFDMALGAERRTALMRRLKPGPSDPIAASGIESDAHPDMPSDYYFDDRLRGARINGLTARQIRSFDISAATATRRSNYRTYLAAFTGLQGIAPLFPHLPAEACPLSMPVLVENRDALAKKLAAQGIVATPWWAGYNRHLDFTDQPEACHLKNHVLSLPCHQYLGEAEVRYIASVLQVLGAG